MLQAYANLKKRNKQDAENHNPKKFPKVHTSTGVII